MQTISNRKNFLYGLILLIIIFTLAIFWPFLSVIVLSGAFAVVLNPVYKWIKTHITRGTSWVASILTILLFFIVLCIPIFFVGKVVISQIQQLYQNIVSYGDTSSFIKTIDYSINQLMPSGFVFDTYGKITSLASIVSGNIALFFASAFKTIVMFVLMILTIFYLLKDGTNWKNNMVLALPLSRDNTLKIMNEMKKAINRILKGSFLIAIVQGFLMGIGLSIFGVPNAAIWGVVAGMASFVPTVGTSLISIPAVIFLFFTGMHVQALGMLIWAMLAVGAIDNVLSPYVISKDTDISSLFILFSILGGISLMGPIGILIGPLVLSLLFSLIKIYKKDLSISD